MSPSKPLRPGQIPLRERRSLAEMWENFRQKAIPNVSDHQTHDMKRAFYAGALVVFEITMENLDPDKEPTEFDIQYVDSIFKEIESFAMRETS